ncbi:hypothetical protein [Polyangium sp. 15x6]|uniref:hypothetical protein n=1 Tax=Polyangium sp. 15x6 TaxID=3042687 RepID=UPI00249B2F09|nr:hypothetical protein [Polyangium sp. 15x6]MDI3285170.1 hypothetical protein [Polyangium sp. 15x6]
MNNKPKFYLDPQQFGAGTEDLAQKLQARFADVRIAVGPKQYNANAPSEHRGRIEQLQDYAEHVGGAATTGRSPSSPAPSGGG